MLSFEEKRRAVIFLMMVLLISDLSAAAPSSAADEPVDVQPLIIPPSPAILIEGLPPLMCPDVEGPSPCDTPDRNIDIAGRHTEETPLWWLGYSPDRDRNGMDDKLQRIIAEEYESISTTAIIGEDGRSTVAIFVDYAWHPTTEEISSLQEVLISHGWLPSQGGVDDAFFSVLRSVDSIAVDHVPISALLDIWSLEGVVVIEMQDVYAPFLSTSVRAIKARGSDTYTSTEAAHTGGIVGSGVVVAVLDTGVDNEHRSLNDFDDQNDDPDPDPFSYNDRKWVAGFDATNTFAETDGSEDPDDGDGHGTHVAGTAIGTGDSSKVQVGVAPGAYLVDVKVLTDTGGTNSQYTARGIQWIIDNNNTNWGNNQSSVGIQIASMSFGTFNALNPNDPGDNGSSVNARLVNDAVDAGILCVIAIGNNGVQQVPSPASADKALVVGAVDDMDTVNRDDDGIAGYSNFGPREDDGDDDDWDELKPDVVAPGTGIWAPQYAAGATPLPGEPQPLADDSYQEMSGTSMSTPHVAGIAALVMQKYPDLAGKPLEVRDLFRNNTLLPEGVGASAPEVTDKWNDHWGFGYVDVERLLGPVYGDQSDSINITSPTDDSWLIAEEEHRIRGTTDVDGNITLIAVQLNWTAWAWEFPEGKPPIYKEKYLFDAWQNAIGTVDWYHDYDAPSVDFYDGWNHTLKVRLLDPDGYVFGQSWVSPNVGYFELIVDNPTEFTPIAGDVSFEGSFVGIEPEKIQYRINSGEWIDGDVDMRFYDYPQLEYGSWSFIWDSTEIFDGLHSVSLRLLNRSGLIGETLSFQFEVDNLPLAPDLAFYGLPEVQIQGLPVEQAYVNSILSVSVDVVNNGDAAAAPSDITVTGAGAEQSLRLEGFEIGEVRTVVISGWTPSILGLDQSVSIRLDSAADLDENFVENNLVEIEFDIVERESGVDLALGSGAVLIRNVQEQFIVPRPFETFYIHVIVENLGTENSGAANLSLEMRTSEGWALVGEQGIVNVLAGGGKEFIPPFESRLDELGAHRFRLTISNIASDLNPANNVLEFNILVDDVQLGANVTIQLRDDETALGYALAGDVGHLLTTYDGELHLRTISSQLQTMDDILLDATFSGEAAIISIGDESQVIWTSRSADDSNYIRMTVSHAVVFKNGQISQITDLLEPIRLSQGSYFGLGITASGSTVAVAGYHRDLSTSGTFQDITSVFLITSDAPLDSESWVYSGAVVFDIEISAAEAGPVAVAIGPASYHVLFQARRDDSTGIERLGMFYAKGTQGTGIWSFQSAVGDYASLAEIEALVNEGGDVALVAAWREGSGENAELITWVTDQMWNDGDRLSTAAPGMTSVDLVKTGDGVQVFYDAVFLGGSVILYGLLSDGDASDVQSLSVRLTKGQLLDSSRGEDGTNIVYLTTSGGVSIRPLAESSVTPPAGESWWQRLQNRLPDDSASALVIRVAGMALLSLFIVLSINYAGKRVKRSRTRRRAMRAQTGELVVELDYRDEVELLQQEREEIEVAISLEAPEPDPPVVEIEPSPLEPDPILLEDDENLSGAELRRKRRLQRQMQRDLADLPPLGDLTPLGLSDLPPLELGDLPPLPSPDSGLGDLPPLDLPPLDLADLPSLEGLPPLKLDKDVSCDECGAIFTLRDMHKRRLRCPVCSATVMLEG